ncbi:MAG TPA: hypothetical protein VNY29_11050 [Terriglobales bacterium]|nr:hypothetical protein [Terriglobales bacterium]
MKFGAIISVGLTGILLMPVVNAGEKDKPKDGEQMVDSGSFGVFMNGRRVATETFSVQQTANGSVVSSQFKTDDAANKAAQSSELQLTPGAEIRKYEWKELSPGKAQATVAPNNDFLMEHISAGPDDKPVEQPFLLPASTSILDDYFFIHREILIWRYLATACKQEKGAIQCPASQKTQFGTMNPHQRSSVPLSLEFTGRDKVTIRGVDRELNKFVLRSEGGDWTMWVDDQFKLQRILIASDATEVVRD